VDIGIIWLVVNTAREDGGLDVPTDLEDIGGGKPGASRSEI